MRGDPMTDTVNALPLIAFCHECGWRDPDGRDTDQPARTHVAQHGHVVSVVASYETLIHPAQVNA